MNNSDIRKTLKQQGIYQWQIAKLLGITEGTFSKWFRDELTNEQVGEILQAVTRR